MRKKKEDKRENPISCAKVGDVIVFGTLDIVQDFPYTFSSNDFQDKKK